MEQPVEVTEIKSEAPSIDTQPLAISDVSKWEMGSLFDMREFSKEDTQQIEDIYKMLGEQYKDRGDILNEVKMAIEQLPPPRVNETKLNNVHRYITLLTEELRAKKERQKLTRW